MAAAPGGGMGGGGGCIQAAQERPSVAQQGYGIR